MGIKNRQNMISLLQREGVASRIDTVSPDTLKKQGVSVLAVDFDGVLASHGEDHPTPETAQWLQKCVKIFGKERVFILTNKPSQARKDYFHEQFHGVTMVTGVRKKPFPDGLISIINKSGLHPNATLLVDDRLLTGGLAACLAGTRMIYISNPYIGLSKRPVRETFFSLLRYLERIFFGLAGKNPIQ